MTATRALIDAEFHDTPIGRCVVLPPRACGDRHCCPGGPVATIPWDISAGDVLAVAETCPTCEGEGVTYDGDCGGYDCRDCDCKGHVRRGFVRVTTVLPVLDQHTYRPHIGATHFVVYPQAVEVWTYDTPNSLPTRKTVAGLTASPGDVVLVTEPWCESERPGGCGLGAPHERPRQECPDCAPSPVRVIHRDGVLGEVET